MKRINEGRAMDMIYMDFSKAFDKVPHARLVHKIRSNGIPGELAIWIQNWLKGRRQRVMAEGGMVSKFAGDTKTGDVVDSKEVYLRVQQELDQMGQWAEEWQMEF
eukprot:g40720.t1